MTELKPPYLQTALEAAARAIDIVRESASRSLEIRTKSSPKDLVTQVDLASEAAIREVISRNHPEHSVLGEEGGLVGKSTYRWIIDPIDGTSNFARGLLHHAVSIGLECEGEGVLGVIAQPTLGDVYRAERRAGSFKNGASIAVSGCQALSEAYVTMSFSTEGATVTQAQALWDVLLVQAHTLRRLGSTALELAWLAEGKVDVFIGFGQGAWDIAAGCVLVEEAGGSVTLLNDGSTCIATSSEALLREIETLLGSVVVVQ